MSDRLPPDWSSHKDAQGRIYYHNKSSGTSQWHFPTTKITNPERKTAQSGRVVQSSPNLPTTNRVPSLNKTMTVPRSPNSARRLSHQFSKMNLDDAMLNSIIVKHSKTPPNFDNSGLLRIYLPVWEMGGKQKRVCSLCKKNSKGHNCRICGKFVCGSCSDKIWLPKMFSKKEKRGPKRVCNYCEEIVVAGAVLIGRDPPANLGAPRPLNTSNHQGSLSSSNRGNTLIDLKSPDGKDDEELWIQCTETLTGRKLWYHSVNHTIRFTPPCKKLPPVPAGYIELLNGQFFDVESGQSEQFYSKEILEDLENHLQSGIAAMLEACNNDWDYKSEDLLLATERASQNSRWMEMKKLVPNAFEQAFPQHLYKSSLDEAEGRSMDVKTKILIQVKNASNMLNGNSHISTVQMSLEDTVEALIAQAVKKLKVPDTDVSRYMLKSFGREEYLATLGMPLCAYRIVHQSYQKKQRLCLRLVYRPKNVEGLGDPRDLWAIMNKRPTTLDDRVFSMADFKEEHKGCIPLEKLDHPFRLKIHGVDNICKDTIPGYEAIEKGFTYFFVRVHLFHGETEIFQNIEVRTGAVFRNPHVTFNQIIEAEEKRVLDSNKSKVKKTTNTKKPKFCDIPPETRLVFALYGYKGEDEVHMLAHVNISMANQAGVLRQGLYTLPMWPCPQGEEVKATLHNYAVLGPISPNRMPISRDDNKEPLIRIGVEFDSFENPVVCPSIPTESKETPSVRQMSSRSKETIKKVKAMDSLKALNNEQKDLVWNNRKSIKDDPGMLPKFLLSVDWTNKADASEARRLMNEWAPLSPYEALELLSYQHADYSVRLYAVNRLRQLGDDELREMLLQITQLLKFEPYHDSPLARFVMERALANPYTVGHFFFWHLKAELHNRDHCERFYFLLKLYLESTPRHFRELEYQNKMISRFEKLADDLVRMKRNEGKNKNYCKMWLQDQLKKVDFPKRLQLTLDPSIQLSGVRARECKFMSSKKLPLWLVCDNVDLEANRKKIYVIFKSGDDLRQDILTLQMLRIMDAFWCSQNLDLKLSPYTCVATGVNKEREGVGMIEVVLNSDTISHIQIDRGGAFDNTTLFTYLQEQIQKQKGIHLLEVKQNFLKSTAGYCVATFNLGIGDRHNGNIMLTKTGQLFHIDFGHFLGNFKSKLGFKRERTPFVFTPEMAYVIGGENYNSSPEYKQFVETCCKAYNIIRAKGQLFITLFRAMKLAGMPELTCDEDIVYLRDQLRLDNSESQASSYFKSQISICVTDKWRRRDNAIHNALHGKG